MTRTIISALATICFSLSAMAQAKIDKIIEDMEKRPDVETTYTERRAPRKKKLVRISRIMKFDGTKYFNELVKAFEDERDNTVSASKTNEMMTYRFENSKGSSTYSLTWKNRYNAPYTLVMSWKSSDDNDQSYIGDDSPESNNGFIYDAYGCPIEMYGEASTSLTAISYSSQRSEERRQSAEARKQARRQSAEARKQARRQSAEARKQAAQARKQAAEARKQAAEARKQAAEARKQAAEAREQAAEARKKAAKAREQAAEARKKAAKAREQAKGKSTSNTNLFTDTAVENALRAKCKTISQNGEVRKFSAFDAIDNSTIWEHLANTDPKANCSIAIVDDSGNTTIIEMGSPVI